METPLNHILFQFNLLKPEPLPSKAQDTNNNRVKTLMMKPLTPVVEAEDVIPLLVVVHFVHAVAVVVNSLDLWENLSIVLLLWSIGFTSLKFLETLSLINKEKTIKQDSAVKEF